MCAGGVLTGTSPDGSNGIIEKEESGMCYNCGCQMPNNDMGHDDNITNKTFEAAAEAMGMSARDAKQNARDLLEKVLAAKEESTDKNWQPS